MKHTEESRAANDRKVAENIREYGCHVISVFDPEEKRPSFSYSVGIQETTGAPEIIVIGLSAKLGHFVVNEYRNQAKAGISFQRGRLYSGFLEGFSVYIEPAKPLLVAEYNLGCERYYSNRPYMTVQLIYPTTAGVWPWQKKASDWFVANQPMLGRKRPDKP